MTGRWPKGAPSCLGRLLKRAGRAGSASGPCEVDGASGRRERAAREGGAWGMEGMLQGWSGLGWSGLITGVWCR